MNLSVIIPVYNEARRLPRALSLCQQYSDWEFIFVNDGSTDQTVDLIKTTKFKLVTYPKNRGKGFALKQGVKEATRQWILITDVDFSTPLSELPKLAKIQADMVIGSRKTTGAKITKHQPAVREWLGRQFTNLTNLWLNLNVSDVTCGFKLFKTTAAKKLFSQVKINRWGYDAEILYLARQENLTIAEIPVVWRNDERTKVNLSIDIARSLIDLIMIRVIHG